MTTHKVGVGEFFDGGQVSEEWVGDDVFDERLRVGCGRPERFLVLAEVGGGDLESVEEHACGFQLDFAEGDAGEDVVDGDLDGRAVVDAGHEEVASASAGSAAGGVVVVAELLLAERGRAAAVAVGEDVAATVAAGWVGFGAVGCGGWNGCR